MTGMCPHCGEEVEVRDSLTAYHDYPKPLRVVCPGSKQIPRCAESDARPLWNGEPNLRFGEYQTISRAEAIEAGLLVGDCAWCGDDVWLDRSPAFVSARGTVWHRDCAEDERDLLLEALSSRKRVPVDYPAPLVESHGKTEP